MDTFFKDSSAGEHFAWDDLIRDVRSTTSYNKYCCSHSYYEVFKHVVTSMLIGREIVLLDSDFSTSEIENITGNSDLHSFARPVDQQELPSIAGKSSIVERVKQTSGDWRITLFTSGTTGAPKRVSHSFESISRFVRTSDKHAANVWGYAYNPTHMAGIQVFFQALLNQNPIVRLFGLSKENVFQEIAANGITNISATPTFYRLLLPSEQTFPSVLRITSGGEKFDERTTGQLKEVFPNAKITNVYASTEAGTLFASKGEWFSIKPTFEKLVKFVDNELLIHKSVMGTTDMDLDEWYSTGDVVEVALDDPLKFRFVSRINEMINVGGYKVNPNEVEAVLRSMPGIKDVRVYAKRNSVLGNIVCCEAIRDDPQLGESSIREYLQSRLQEFKIPRLVRFVDDISTTRTGKAKRA